MSALEQAIEDVSAAISKATSTRIPLGDAKTVSAEDLHKLAQALSWMKFGQQGVTDYRYVGRYEQTYVSDQHETHHDGEKRQRPAGFDKRDSQRDPLERF